MLVGLAVCFCASAVHAQVSLNFAGTTAITLGSGFSNPRGVRVDKAGNVFVADTNNNAVREIVAVNGSIPPVNPTILTLGSGFNGPGGIALDAGGDVFVADNLNNVVKEIVAVNGTIPATNPTILTLGSGFSTPAGIAVDTAGDLFIADFANNAVKEIVAVGGTIPATNPTILTLGSGFNRPQDVAVDAAGNVFVADSGNGVVKEMLAVGGSIPATNPTILTLGSGFIDPDGLAVNALGDLFVGDSGNGTVKEIVAVSGSIPTNPTILTLGSGLPHPGGVAVDAAGDVFIAESTGVATLQLNSVNFGNINVCPSGIGAPAPCTQTLTLNYNVTPSTTLGTINVTNEGTTGLDFNLAANNTCTGAVTAGTCTVNVTFAPKAAGLRSGAVQVTDANNKPLATTLILGNGGAPQVAFLPGAQSVIQPTGVGSFIWGVAVDASGAIYFSDPLNNAVSVLRNGTQSLLPFTGLFDPLGVAVDGDGSVYVNNGGVSIVKLDSQNSQTTVATGSTLGLVSILSFTLDGHGGLVLGATDFNNTGRVLQVSSGGTAQQIGGAFTQPFGIAVGAGGTVYVSDYLGQATGTGSNLYAIDPQGNRKAIGSSLLTPFGIAVDPGGTVYAVDITTDSLIVIDSTGVQTTFPQLDLLLQFAAFGGYQVAMDGNGSLYFGGFSISGQQQVGSIAKIDRTQGRVEFGNVPVGTASTAQAVTVSNIGNQPLTLTGGGVNSPYFAEQPSTGTPVECGASLASGATCVVTAVFTPGVAGQTTYNFPLIDNALNAPGTIQSVLFDGTGTAAVTPTAMTITGPVASINGGPLNLFTVIETDATGAPAVGDNNLVNLQITAGPQQFNFLSTTLANGQGTLTQTLVEPGSYTIVGTDAVNGLTTTHNFVIPSSGGPGLNYANLALALSPATPYYSDKPELTVTVTGANTPPPYGTISYSVDNGNSITANLNTPISGPTTAAVALGSLPVGTHSVSVTYSGGGANNFYQQSGPQVLNFTVADPAVALLSAEQALGYLTVSSPVGTAIDSAGNLYVADTFGAQVVEYSPAGQATVVPITGLVNPNGLALDSNGNLYVSDSSLGQVIEYSASTGQIRLSFEGLGAPGKIAVDLNGNKYVADPSNNRVTMLNVNSVQSTIAATGLNAPQGVAVDTAGNIYIADTGNGRVVKLDANGNQTTIFTSSVPVAVAVDTGGNVYVADSELRQIIRIDALGHQLQLNSAQTGVTDVTPDPLGDVFVPTGGSVLELTPGLKFPDTAVAGTASTVLANFLIPSAQTFPPRSAATDLLANNEFSAAGTSTSSTCAGVCSYQMSFAPVLPGIRSGSVTLISNGAPLFSASTYGNGLAPLAVLEPRSASTQLAQGKLVNPVALAIDSAGAAYIADASNNTIFKQPSGGQATPFFAGVQPLAGVAADGLGNLYATYFDDTLMLKIGPQGTATNFASNLVLPGPVAVDGAGNVYVADEGFNGPLGGEVRKLDPSGNASTISCCFASTPTGLAVDSQGNVYTAATDPATGLPSIIETAPPTPVSGNQGIVLRKIALAFNPGNLAVDAGGEIFVVDTTDDKIVRIDAAGNQTQIQNLQSTGFKGLALDGSNNLYYTALTPATAFELASQSASLQFTAAVGTTSPSQTVTFTNAGNQPLNIAAVSTQGLFNLGAASQGQTACVPGTTVATGAGCALPFVFIPASAGTLAGSGTITDNSLNVAGSAQNIALQGTATGAVPTSLTLTGPTTGVSGTTGTYTITELGANGVAVAGDSNAVIVTIVGPSSNVNITVTLTNGVGTFPLAFASHALEGNTNYTLTAVDSINSNLFAQLSLVVTPATVTTTLTLVASPAGSSVFGQAVTLTATLAPFAGGNNTTDGETVTFTNGGASIGTGTLAAGVATLTIATLPVSADLLAASYPGDANFSASNSNPIGYAVLQPLLAFTVPPLSFLSSGAEAGTISVANEVAGGTTVVQPAVAITLTVTGPGGYSQVYGPVTTNNGVSSFDTSANALTVPGTYTYTATSANSTTAFLTQTVVPEAFAFAAGGQTVGTASTPQTVTLVFNTPTTLTATNAIQVVTQGVQNLDFTASPTQPNGACTAATAYLAGQSCTVSVIFTPKAPGQRLGAVLLNGTIPGSSIAGVVTEAFLSGVGDGPLVDFVNPASTTLVSTPTVSAPEGIAVDAVGNVFVVDSPNAAVVELSAGGGTPTNLNLTGLSFPVAVAIDGSGNIYVLDQGNGSSRVVELPAGGAAQKTIYTSQDTLSGVAVDGSGIVYVSDQSASQIYEVFPTGTSQLLAGATSGLLAPQGLAIDPAGNLDIADSGNNRIEQLAVGSTGLTTLVAGLANSPNAIAIDPAGNLFIAESQGNSITEVNSAGVPVGSLTQGIGHPLGVALDGLGNLFVASPNTGSAVEFPRSALPTLTFAAQAPGVVSAPQPVTVQNSGNQPLAFTAIAAGTNTALDPATTTCATTANVASAGSCNLGVEFAPPSTAAGGATLTGSITLSDNAPNAPQAVNLTGAVSAAVAPTITSLTPNSAVAGVSDLLVTIAGSNFVTGAVVSINGTSQAATFVSSSQLTTTIAAANLANVGVLTVSVVNPGGPASNSLNFTVIAQPVQVTPAVLSFGNQAVGTQSAAQTVTVTNTAATPLTINQIALQLGADPNDFSQTNNCPATLAAGASCQISVLFAPTGVGPKRAGLGVYDNSPPQPQFVTVTGTGTGGILQVEPGNLKTIAGGSTASVALNAPNGLGFDPQGNLYIADQANNVIRRVDTAGNVTNFAGNGTPGFSGDGGPATSAELNQPNSVTSDAAGNIYIQDTLNSRVRKVDLTGTITTFAGNGTAGFSGDGGPATSAELFDNQGARFDALGNLYVPQCLNAAVRKIDKNGIITTVAGNGTNGFSGDGGPATAAQLACPSGIAIDKNGQLFIADFGSNRIRKVDTNGIITTIAGNGNSAFSGDGGPATAAALNIPNDVDLDSSGNIYIADNGNNRIRRIDLNGVITTLAGGLNNAGSAGINTPLALTLDSANNLYFSDTGNNAVREFFPAGASVFPSTPVGTPASTLTVMLRNIGNLPVTIASQQSFALSGDAADFSLAGGTCLQGTTLPAGGAPCSLILSFTPTAVGTRTVTIGVTDSAVASPQSFQVSGIGAPATTSLVLTANPSTVRTPGTVSLTATLTSAVNGATGQVTFFNGTTVLGQAALGSSGTAVLAGVSLPVGSNSITASYAGNTNFAASTSSPVTVVVESSTIILSSIAPAAGAAGSADTKITATGSNFTPASIVNFAGTPLATTFVSATQLTAIIPAALLAIPENAAVTVIDTQSLSTSAAQTFTVLPAIAVTFSGPPMTNPNEQPTLNFTLQQAYPTQLNGTMTLTFTPAAGNPDNPEVQFATGGRTFNFTLQPNTTDTPLVLVQAGTTSGTITVTLQLTSGGVNVTPTNVAPIAILVPKVAPTVSKLSFTTSGKTLTVVVTGFSSTREIQSADFTFTPAKGASLATKSVTVPASSLFGTWYTNESSAKFGSSFTYTQIFNLSDPATAVAGVGVTLTNTVGTSTEASAP